MLALQRAQLFVRGGGKHVQPAPSQADKRADLPRNFRTAETAIDIAISALYTEYNQIIRKNL